jgi:CRP/FNR family transcriptional regulator, cyclic AMP receptor protein
VPIQSIDDVLATLPTFAGLEPDQLELIAGCGQNTGFEAGEYMAREGTAAETFFVVRHGHVALELPGAARSLRIATLGEGAVVGWSWLLPPYRWSFDALAVEPVRAIVFDGACLRGKCDADPALGYALMQRFAGIILDRLQATRLQLLDVYGSPTDSG